MNAFSRFQEQRETCPGSKDTSNDSLNKKKNIYLKEHEPSRRSSMGSTLHVE